MFVAVCYDVSNNRKRRQVVKVLEGFGQRVQKSVFECQFGDKQFVELKRRLSKIQLPEGDLVRYYCLCQACQGRVEFFGGLPPDKPERHRIV